VDAQTHSPISGAKAVVCYPLPSPYEGEQPTIEEALTNTRPPQVTSDSNGKFFIRPEHHWIIYFPSPEMAPAEGFLVVRRDSYEPEMIGLWTDGVVNVGSISLKPVMK